MGEQGSGAQVARVRAAPGKKEGTSQQAGFCRVLYTTVLYLSVSICIHAGQASANLKHLDLACASRIYRHHHHRRSPPKTAHRNSRRGTTACCHNGLTPGRDSRSINFVRNRRQPACLLVCMGHEGALARLGLPVFAHGVNLACHRDYSPEKKNGSNPQQKQRGSLLANCSRASGSASVPQGKSALEIGAAVLLFSSRTGDRQRHWVCRPVQNSRIDAVLLACRPFPTGDPRGKE